MSAPFGSLRMTRLSCFAPRNDPPRAGRSSGDCRSSASLSFQPTSEAESAPLWPTGHTHGEQTRLFG